VGKKEITAALIGISVFALTFLFYWFFISREADIKPQTFKYKKKVEISPELETEKKPANLKYIIVLEIESKNIDIKKIKESLRESSTKNNFKIKSEKIYSIKE
jgi:hypothetical protein